MLEVLDIGRRIVKKEVKRVCQFFRLCEVGLQHEFVALIEDCLPRILKNRVGDGIAQTNLLAESR